MKIAFLCGSLEAGKDGVGDYTRLLAREFIKQDHEVLIIALNDRYISNEIEYSDETLIEILRLPALNDNKITRSRTSMKISSFNPDWVSLQYVPFSFHDKGLPFHLSSFLKILCKRRKIHIMFHELWVGMDRASTLKHRLWGLLQKRIIKDLVNSLDVDLMNTSTNLYREALKTINIKADLLRLFGNIPVVGEKQSAVHEIKLIVFGGIHYGARILAFAQESAKFSKLNNIQITLNFVGRCGKEQDLWAGFWKSAGLTFKIWGEQSQESISRLLLSATAGLTSTPFSLVEKSGSVAAMIEHGLPVICLAREWQTRYDFNLEAPAFVRYYRNGDFPDLISNLNQQGSDYGVASVANQLLNDMKS